MIKKWLTWINYALGSLTLLLIASGGLFLLYRPAEIPVYNDPPPKTALPKKAIPFSPESYKAIGEPLLSLHYSPMSQQLPDLKRYLIYYGKNGRPDAIAEKPLMHFAFSGNKTISSFTPGEKLYILYDRKLNPPQYVFSPGNEETSLWIDAMAEGSEAKVSVSMRGENGKIIKEPSSNANFDLPEKEYVRLGGSSHWEIGKTKVDATLLARQKGRWYGHDLFFERHGGKEYADIKGKQRIDFGEGEGVYSVFVNLNDSLVWDKEHWKVVKPGAESLGKPLLVIKKIDERLMNLELWDPEGKGKVLLNLLKSSEITPSTNSIDQFKFVGARTRTQFVFEIGGERILLSPHDWLLQTKDGWKKLETPQEVDDYVERRLTGPLFVVNEVEKRDDKQYMLATLFNAARTGAQALEIPLQKTACPTPGQKKGSKVKPSFKQQVRTPSVTIDEDVDEDEDEDEESDGDDDDEME
jgi:hypothetical protein